MRHSTEPRRQLFPGDETVKILVNELFSEERHVHNEAAYQGREENSGLKPRRPKSMEGTPVVWRPEGRSLLPFDPSVDGDLVL